MTDGFSNRRFPPELDDLKELALDLRFNTNWLSQQVCERLDPIGWERMENPYLILLNASQEQLESCTRDKSLLQELAKWREIAKEYRSKKTWFEGHHANDSLRRVAYFSMEFGLSEALPIYSGGLGMLAGDHLKSASDLGIPLVGIGILYQQGYFRQVLDAEGNQQEAFPFNDPSSLPVTPVVQNGRWQRVSLELPGRTLMLRTWQARVGRIPLYLLDSNDPHNNAWDRGITANLYDAGRDKRFLQEIVLGVGGWKLLAQLGIDVDVCHLNEGHAAFAVLARAASYSKKTGLSPPEAFRATRAGNVFTTHTPVSAAFDEFDPSLIRHYAKAMMEKLSIRMKNVLAQGRRNPDDESEPFNMAFLAMRGCCHVNGVSQLHGRVSRKLFAQLYPGWPEAQVPIGAITNGVHIPTWNSDPARELWCTAGGDDGSFDDLPTAEKSLQKIETVDLWNMRGEARGRLVGYVRRRLARQMRNRGALETAVQKADLVLDPNALTLGFARRFTAYKRPTLLLQDPDRFLKLFRDPAHPLQLIVAGKAHPNDEHGKSMVQTICQFATHHDLQHRVIFLEDYDMVLAQRLAAGVDVWLNTPRRFAEACGTSGMKMLFNGGLNLSVSDGWWDEAWTSDSGWVFGASEDVTDMDVRDADEMYSLLENNVIPEFYDRDSDGIPHRWLKRVATSMSQLTSRFSSHRMVKDYAEQAYLPAARAVEHRTADNAKVARELFHWNENLRKNWRSLRFGNVEIAEGDAAWRFEVTVYLGDLEPGLVRVELYADSVDGLELKIIPLVLDRRLPGAVNGFVFIGEASMERPANHYTPRIVPWHPDAFVPTEEPHIHWY